MSAPQAVAVPTRQFEAICGAEHVITNEAQLASRAIDTAIPRVIVAPGSPEELGAVLRIANNAGLVVVPAGNGTRQNFGRPPAHVDVVITTRRLNRVLHYDPGDLTISVEAGATVSEVCSRVAAERQLFPVDCAHPEHTTIGGLLATAAHGPLKHAFGGVREFCIGVQFVTTDGKVAKAGARVVKNVAGYDLMKLLIGSFGTLGIITSANFRLFPAPRQTRTWLCTFPSASNTLALRDRVLRSSLTPLTLELISPGVLAHAQAGKVWSVIMQASGSDRVLARYAAELGSAVTLTRDADAEKSFWKQVREDTAQLRADAMLVRVNCTASQVAGVITAAENAGREQHFATSVFGRAAGSLNVIFTPQHASANHAAALHQFRAALPRGASAVVVHAPAEQRRSLDVWGTPTTDLASTQLVRDALDPRQTLNRGRFVV